MPPREYVNDDEDQERDDHACKEPDQNRRDVEKVQDAAFSRTDKPAPIVHDRISRSASSTASIFVSKVMIRPGSCRISVSISSSCLIRYSRSAVCLDDNMMLVTIFIAIADAAAIIAETTVGSITQNKSRKALSPSGSHFIKLLSLSQVIRRAFPGRPSGCSSPSPDRIWRSMCYSSFRPRP